MYFQPIGSIYSKGCSGKIELKNHNKYVKFRRLISCDIKKGLLQNKTRTEIYTKKIYQD